MSVMIRLSRQGAKKKPQFLIVAANKRSKRDGEYLAKIGYYFPKAKKEEEKLKIDNTALQQWLKQGATCTQTVGQLLKTLSK